MSDENSYINQIRAIAGDRKLLYVATRALICDEFGRVLFIRRRDNGNWALPSGGLELDETVYECMVREVKEETGLVVNSATPLAIYSGPEYDYITEAGHPYQFIFITFRVDDWHGELIAETEETTDARFFSFDELPDTHTHYLDVLTDLQEFDGKLILR
jgi:8-oxo-dGTP pyrophosphatase MutT (NUDIX family)